MTCVLIGTPETVALTARQLALLDGGPRAVGCVLVDGASEGGDGRPGRDLPPVLGGAGDLADICLARAVSLAVVSLPASMRSEIAGVRRTLRAMRVTERFLPPLPELLSHEPEPVPRTGRIDVASLDLSALVGRRAHEIDREQVAQILRDRRVLITGAGGSIGSELATIVAGFGPSRLVLMERSENALFEIDRRLAARHPDVDRAALLHDVVERDRTLALLRRQRPDVVFHAAAHKHVPLMEDHPGHALLNNFFGTRSIADAAGEVGAERFVLISSDKAVNPSSVMGATKRLAELYVQGLARRGSGVTRFSSVRFGNVLGSACSVLPIWAAQLGEDGRITVTDERMTRYFMTIPEAAALVIQAAALSGRCPKEAEIFVLDMGEPVRIMDLARRFIAACGMEALGPCRRRAEIVLTGARPGEKLHEELAYAAELLRPTEHPGISALASSEAPEPADLAAMVSDLELAVEAGEHADALSAIQRHVPSLRAALAA